jgi:hypothetical protein
MLTFYKNTMRDLHPTKGNIRDFFFLEEILHKEATKSIQSRSIQLISDIVDCGFTIAFQQIRKLVAGGYHHICNR